MNLQEAERYLLDRELFGMRLGLGRMHRLLTALGLPQRRFASVHVVGTNGKSSTTRMIAALLERHGLRTGAYTSPHLRSFAERIEVGGRPIEGDDFGAAVTRVAHAVELLERGGDPDDRFTQFEALTAAAFDELARRRVGVAVVEAGLGGRLDATNVLPSRVQVLTSVGLEHTRWLGDTLAAIAEEKLAVVPHQGRLVVGELPPEAAAVAERVARERGAQLVHAPPPDAVERPARALGAFQRRNFAVAVAGAEAFLGGLDPAAVRAAALAVEVPGRLQPVGHDPLVLLDGAHNPDGARALAAALPEVTAGRRLVGVIAVLDDKDARALLAPLLPLLHAVVLTRAATPRSLPPDALAAVAAELGAGSPEVVEDAHAALARAQDLAGREGVVLATGSLHLVADLVREPGAARASAF